MGAGFSEELADGLSAKLRTKLEVVQHALAANDPTLVEVALPNHGLKDTGIQLGVDALAQSTHVLSLDLAYNGITGHGVTLLMQHLSTAPLGRVLRELRLSGNAIGLEGCRAISNFLDATARDGPPCALESLYLYQCELDDECALLLANAMQLQSSVTALNLDRNHLTKKTAIMFEQCLAHNRSLCVLSFVPKAEEHTVVFPESVMQGIEASLERNREIVAHKKSIEDIKRRKQQRREQQKEDEKRRHDAELAAEQARAEAQLRELAALQQAEDANVRDLEKKLHDTVAMRNQKAAMDASARQRALQRAIEEAYEWRKKLTGGGTLQKEWHIGFTVLKTEPGQVGGTPTISPELPRRLKACWCDPQDATAPYAKTLHYHCKWENHDPSAEESSKHKTHHSVHKGGHNSSGIANASIDSGYTGCKGTGHICASVGFYTTPRPDRSAPHFFASPHPHVASNLITEETD